MEDLAADDFEGWRAQMAERWGPVQLGNAITCVKSVVRYALDNALLERAPRFGSEFKKPGKSVLRRHRTTDDERMVGASQLHAMVDGALVVGDDGPQLVQADRQLKATILLGVNAGFGNHDVATLPLSALDLEHR